MTSEERLDRVEKLLVQQGELIEKHQSAIRDLIVVSRTTLTSVGETRGSVQELRDSVQELRDSVQELRESVQELRESVQELREAQSATDEKLNILIETVDRIVRRLNGKE